MKQNEAFESQELDERSVSVSESNNPSSATENSRIQKLQNLIGLIDSELSGERLKGFHEKLLNYRNSSSDQSQPVSGPLPAPATISKFVGGADKMRRDAEEGMIRLIVNCYWRTLHFLGSGVPKTLDELLRSINRSPDEKEATYESQFQAMGLWAAEHGRWFKDKHGGLHEYCGTYEVDRPQRQEGAVTITLTALNNGSLEASLSGLNGGSFHGVVLEGSERAIQIVFQRQSSRSASRGTTCFLFLQAPPESEDGFDFKGIFLHRPSLEPVAENVVLRKIPDSP